MKVLVQPIVVGAIATTMAAFVEERIVRPDSNRLIAQLKTLHLIIGYTITVLSIVYSKNEY